MHPLPDMRPPPLGQPMAGMPMSMPWEMMGAPTAGLPNIAIPGGPVLTAPPPGFAPYPFYNPYAYAAALAAQFPQPGSIPGQLPMSTNDVSLNGTGANAIAGPSGTSHDVSGTSSGMGPVGFVILCRMKNLMPPYSTGRVCLM